MKKCLFSLLVSGLCLFSCNRGGEEAGAVIAGEQCVSIGFSVPDVLGGKASRAAAGYVDSGKGGVTNLPDESVTFHVALYLGSKLVYSDSQSTAAANRDVTFSPTLVMGETYKVVAWAQFGTDEVADLSSIGLGAAFNDEKADAYFFSEDMEAKPVMAVELKRPFGKLRLIAEDYGTMCEQMGRKVVSVEVTYDSGRYTAFNALTGEFSGTGTQKVFSADMNTYSADPEGAQTLFVDYIPVDADGATMFPFELKVTCDDGTTLTRKFTQDIPVKRNCLTTLTGKLFTQDAQLKLSIDEEFGGETEVVIVTTLEELTAAIMEGAIVEIPAGTTIDVSAMTPVSLPDETTVWVNGEIHSTCPNLFQVKDGNTVTITGSGVFRTTGPDGRGLFSVSNDGKLILEGVTIETEQNNRGSAVYSDGGHVELDGVTINAAYYAISANGGTANIRNSSFHSTSTNLNGAWAYCLSFAGATAVLDNLTVTGIQGGVSVINGADVTINGGDYSTHNTEGKQDAFGAAYVANGGQLTINDGKFYSPRKNYAVFNGNNDIAGNTLGSVFIYGGEFSDKAYWQYNGPEQLLPEGYVYRETGDERYPWKVVAGE